MSDAPGIDVFETVRPKLMGLAYRMLGSMADAEDAVQDTYLKWQTTDRADILNPEAFLTTVCTNCCLDTLKAAHRKRVDYVGPWIPEPLQFDSGSDPETDLDRAQSLTTAFLLLLERLSPKERAAYLLREIFAQPYDEVAQTLGVTEQACRQLVSRASRHVQGPASRFVPSADHQDRILSAFLTALETGSTDRLTGLLAETVQLQSDGGGKATAMSRILVGADEVARYVVLILGRLWEPCQIEILDLNGTRGLVLFHGEEIVTAVMFGYDADGRLEHIYNMRNPDKLSRLKVKLRHDRSSGAIWH
ncbi:Sigma-24 (FecI) [Stappia aggregata IAM 12614]|uniref:Sigma-24 (FecI) n=1 Tax=Roseibium aggregatum (strain ATCC 25650 / DSM 13394 / JCM 20685 / NBRC 16684 / NCIMB 2208 / IAM 12614 / B1) TaxID=384765 RepID=A0NXH3_ROSAI|nr:RNA polymerase sigma factor SigJ [Roseibium aggregatum]EAV42500.1 Sigma-24 (FecI) [Stappia aggregata IAM 12614] [Roseibium aggregatum IAM 12614]